MSTYCVSGPVCPALGCCVRAFCVSENGLLNDTCVLSLDSSEHALCQEVSCRASIHSASAYFRVPGPWLLCATPCVPGPVWPWLPTVCQELGFCVSIS